MLFADLPTGNPLRVRAESRPRACVAAVLQAIAWTAVALAVAAPLRAHEIPLVNPSAAAGQIGVDVVAEALPQPASIVPVAALALRDLEELALRCSPSLQVASAQVQAARGRQWQSGLYPNPVVGYNGQNMGEDNSAGQQGGYVEQEFITGGKLKLNSAVGGCEVLEKRFLFDAQQLRVLTDVRLRFYQALTAQRQLELSSQLVDVSGQLASSSQQLLDAQQISTSDLLQAQIEVEESQILYANAGNRQAEAWRRLAATVGATELPSQPLAGALDADLPMYDWETVYATVLGRHPELSAAGARVERARIAIERARRQNIPDVNVQAMAAHMNQNDFDVGALQAIMPLPIWNRNQGGIMEAQAELTAAVNRVRRIELDLQDRLAIAFRRYANARQQTDRYRQEILPRAEKSLDLVRGGYQQGQVDFLALLTSQRTFIRVNIAYVAALSELRQAATLIDGQLLAGSLQGE